MGKLMGRLHDRTSCCRVVVIFCLLCFAGCTGYIMKADRPKGVYHRIKQGETLWSIARAYRVSVQDIAEINNIQKPSQIEADEVLFIPERKQVIDDAMSSILKEKAPPVVKRAAKTPGMKEPAVRAAGRETTNREGKGAISREGEAGASAVAASDKLFPSGGREKTGDAKMREDPPGTEIDYGEEEVAPAVSGAEGGKASAETGTKQAAPAKRTEELQFERKRFLWPVKGNVVSRFGIQPNGMFYNGIRIAAKEGQQVVAADGGAVIFSAAIKDYGETVIIKHDDDYATVYTNLGSRAVKTEDRVKKGDLIALLAKGDKKPAVFMNFEIRYKNKARNPLFFLP